MGAAAARLEVVAGNAVGMSIIVDDELVIGRHAEGAGQLADDDEISRLHARLAVDSEGSCAIQDLGSTNGTFVNGERISAPYVLSVGDTIELGQTTLAVRELPEAGPEPAPDSAPFAPEIPAPVPATPLTAQQELGPPHSLAAGAPAGEAEAEPPPPPLSVRLEVDFAGHQALIFLDPASEPVRLVFEAGAWRLLDSPGTS